jgi:hypothetical protein
MLTEISPLPCVIRKVNHDMTNIQIKPNKARERSFLFRFLYCFLWCTAVLFIIFAAVGGRLFTFNHLIIFVICCIPLSILYAILVEKLGTGLFSLLSGWSDRKSPARETYSADIAKVRFSKSRGEFSNALLIINEVLEKDPEFPEAIFLKAQIEWEGFKSGSLARENLDKVLELVKDDEPFRKRVSNYYMLLIKNEGDKDVS